MSIHHGHWSDTFTLNQSAISRYHKMREPRAKCKNIWKHFSHHMTAHRPLPVTVCQRLGWCRVTPLYVMPWPCPCPPPILLSDCKLNFARANLMKGASGIGETKMEIKIVILNCTRSFWISDIVPLTIQYFQFELFISIYVISYKDLFVWYG